ncbi:hypothetical protein NE237_025881 [Protea cynaroides]|uniref:Uncharacterized protein n=1 Tax=Protea cynaroides TaxID=273540 RepID=A0A9Q0H3V1_9MAGN|nr:hypothetical protein NE237_025881 [Protea cynaroides]
MVVSRENLACLSPSAYSLAGESGNVKSPSAIHKSGLGWTVDLKDDVDAGMKSNSDSLADEVKLSEEIEFDSFPTKSNSNLHFDGVKFWTAEMIRATKKEQQGLEEIHSFNRGIDKFIKQLIVELLPLIMFFLIKLKIGITLNSLYRRGNRSDSYGIPGSCHQFDCFPQMGLSFQCQSLTDPINFNRFYFSMETGFLNFSIVVAGAFKSRRYMSVVVHRARHPQLKDYIHSAVNGLLPFIQKVCGFPYFKISTVQSIRFAGGR